MMIALGAFAIVQMGRVNAETRAIGDDAIPTLKLINSLDNTIIKYRTAQLRHIIEKGSAKASEAEDEMKKLEEQMAAFFQEYQPLLTEKDEREAADQLQTLWTSYVTFNDQNLLPLAGATRA
jgi:methyl-accepting chemotaxis protein